jgi:ecotin
MHKILPLALLIAAAPAKPPADIAMFPKAAQGMRQVVIRPPRRADEAQVRIEFYAGQIRTIDCNLVTIPVGLIRREVQGWAYPYWEMNPPPPAITTLMGCPPKSERQAFVHGRPETIDYRSALPIVVYVPVSYTVRYRIWRTDGAEAEGR